MPAKAAARRGFLPVVLRRTFHEDNLRARHARVGQADDANGLSPRKLSPATVKLERAGRLDRRRLHCPLEIGTPADDGWQLEAAR